MSKLEVFLDKDKIGESESFCIHMNWGNYKFKNMDGNRFYFENVDGELIVTINNPSRDLIDLKYGDSVYVEYRTY